MESVINTSENTATNQKKIKWITLQSLLGGMALGAEKAFGCPPAAILNYDGVENTEAYVHYMNSIRELNIPYYTFDGNIYSKAETFKDDKKPDFSDVDVVSAVPICTGLSFANTVNDKEKANARGSDAQQNQNMINCCEFSLKHIKPKVYIFENAPALFSSTGKGVRDKLDEICEKYGYKSTYIRTDTKYHHNVQARPRTFGIFTKDKAPVIEYINNPFSGTILDYLKNIPKDAKYQDILMFKNFEENGYMKYVKAKWGKDYRKEWSNDAPNVTAIVLNHNDDDFACSLMNEKESAFIRHAREKVSKGMSYFDNTPIWYGFSKVNTIFGRTVGRLVHPSEERGYNMRELLTFMGMPYDFEYPGLESKSQWIGQNVPVMTSYDMHCIVKDFIEGKCKTIDTTGNLFNNCNCEKKAFRFGV